MEKGPCQAKLTPCSEGIRADKGECCNATGNLVRMTPQLKNLKITTVRVNRAAEQTLSWPMHKRLENHQQSELHWGSAGLHPEPRTTPEVHLESGEQMGKAEPPDGIQISNLWHCILRLENFCCECKSIQEQTGKYEECHHFLKDINSLIK